MIALDTNILVHAHRAEASLHNTAKVTVKKLAEYAIKSRIRGAMIHAALSTALQERSRPCAFAGKREGRIGSKNQR